MSRHVWENETEDATRTGLGMSKRRSNYRRNAFAKSKDGGFGLKGCCFNRVRHGHRGTGMGVVLLRWIGWADGARRCSNGAIGSWLVDFGVRCRGRNCCNFIRVELAGRAAAERICFICTYFLPNGQRNL